MELGPRVREARERAGWSIRKFAAFLDIDEDTARDLESGHVRISSDQVFRIAEATGRSLLWFTERPLSAVASRRASLAEEGEAAVDSEFDRLLEEIGIDVHAVVRDELLQGGTRPEYTAPRDPDRAEDLAHRVRRDYSAPSGPLDLVDLCEKTGLFPFSFAMNERAVLGSMIEVAPGAGIALVNGSIPAGQRRFTLAHELGHWLVGDDFEGLRTSRSETERLLNVFAKHLLRGEEQGELRNHHQELEAPFISPRYREAVLCGYRTWQLATDRALDMLRGSVARAELPERELRVPGTVRRAR